MSKQVWGIEMCGNWIANLQVFPLRRLAIEHLRKSYPEETLVELQKNTGLRVVKLVWE